MLTRDEETKKYQHNWYLQNKEKILIRGKKWKQKYPWKSGRIIQRILGIANTSISSVCLGKRKSAGGFIWKFQEVNDVD